MINNNEILLDSLEVNPGSAPVASVIWLHGLGADGYDFKPVVSELNLPKDLPIRFVFPHAPMRAVTINNGYVMRAWYDIVSLQIDNHADQHGINESQKQLNHLIEREIQSGIPANKIILAGFSQGAVIALSTGLRYPERLAGILALSGYLPFAEKVIAEASPANKHTPIFIGHGTEDTVVPFFLGTMTNDVLTKNHYPVSWHSYPMPHSVCMEEIQDIREWILNVVAK